MSDHGVIGLSQPTIDSQKAMGATNQVVFAIQNGLG